MIMFSFTFQISLSNDERTLSKMVLSFIYIVEKVSICRHIE